MAIGFAPLLRHLGIEEVPVNIGFAPLVAPANEKSGSRDAEKCPWLLGLRHFSRWRTKVAQNHVLRHCATCATPLYGGAQWSGSTLRSFLSAWGIPGAQRPAADPKAGEIRCRGRWSHTRIPHRCSKLEARPETRAYNPGERCPRVSGGGSGSGKFPEAVRSLAMPKLEARSSTRAERASEARTSSRLGTQCAKKWNEMFHWQRDPYAGGTDGARNGRTDSWSCEIGKAIMSIVDAGLVMRGLEIVGGNFLATPWQLCCHCRCTMRFLSMRYALVSRGESLER